MTRAMTANTRHLNVDEHAQLIYAQLIREYVRRQGDNRLIALDDDFTPTDYIPSVLVSHVSP